MTLISAYGPLNYAGCFAATLSTALASYISCPKLLQVIGDDGLFPHWMVGWMTKGYGKSKEPHIAYLFTFFVALAFILIGKLQLSWNFTKKLINIINFTISWTGYDRSPDFRSLPNHIRLLKLRMFSRRPRKACWVASHFQGSNSSINFGKSNLIAYNFMSVVLQQMAEFIHRRHVYRRHVPDWLESVVGDTSLRLPILLHRFISKARFLLKVQIILQKFNWVVFGKYRRQLGFFGPSQEFPRCPKQHSTTGAHRRAR